LKLKKIIKDFLLFFPLTYIFLPFNRLLHFLYWLNRLIRWIHQHKKGLLLCDFYTPVRNYEKRYTLYKSILEHLNLQEKKIIYLEFGVASGKSFDWWLSHNNHAQSSFRGFDTFEGLPENWGGYEKGAMAHALPTREDQRAVFIKGLFQDSLPVFINQNRELLADTTAIRVLHLDADLYSSTAFVLSQLYASLKPGDILLFDEFSVPLHEFRAFEEFKQNFYIQLKPLASVNNFYQTAFIVDSKK